MSNNCLRSDNCTYKKNLQQSAKPVSYILDTPCDDYRKKNSSHLINKDNSIRGLNQWAKQQISPGGLIYSGKRGMNLFAKGTFSVVFNNLLSTNIYMRRFMMRTLMFSRQIATPTNHRTTRSGTIGRANVQESESQYLLQVAVPGIRREDISLTAIGSRLDISGKRQSLAPEKSEPAGIELGDRLERSFHFSSQLDDAGIQASVSNGLLTVVLPKTCARVIPVSRS